MCCSIITGSMVSMGLDLRVDLIFVLKFERISVFRLKSMQTVSAIPVLPIFHFAPVGNTEIFFQFVSEKV